MNFKEFINESAIDKEKAFWEPYLKDIPKTMAYEISAQGLLITDAKGKRFLNSISSYQFKKNKLDFKKDIIGYAQKVLDTKPVDNSNPKKVNFGGAIPTWGLD